MPSIRNFFSKLFLNQKGDSPTVNKKDEKKERPLMNRVSGIFSNRRNSGKSKSDEDEVGFSTVAGNTRVEYSISEHIEPVCLCLEVYYPALMLRDFVECCQGYKALPIIFRPRGVIAIQRLPSYLLINPAHDCP